jgi:outer membrane protein assembly factor BamB
MGYYMCMIFYNIAEIIKSNYHYRASFIHIVSFAAVVLIVLQCMILGIPQNPALALTKLEAWRGDSAAIAVDLLGNIYITGPSAREGWGDSGNGTEWVIVKYDANGRQIWVRTYDGGGAYYNGADAIAVDRKGNVYVTGYVSPSSYAIVKYDPNGRLCWEHRYPYKIGEPWKNCIAVDSRGNAYVSIDQNSRLVKLNTNGDLIWEKPEYVAAILIDTDDSIIIGGDNSLRKYDADGNRLWQSVSGAQSIAIDANNNIYTHIAKFSSDGKIIWSHNYTGGLVTVDKKGNTATFGKDFKTTKYDAQGNQIWQQLYNSGGYTGFWEVPSAGIDDAGNVYVTETIYKKNTAFKITVKYAANGTQQWEKESLGTSNGLLVDKNNNVFITGSGTNRNTAIPSSSYSTQKYDCNGNLIWEAYYTKSPTDITVMNPARGSQGNTMNVIISGYCLDLVTEVDFGEGIKTNSYTIDSQTQITASITIDRNALPGIKNPCVRNRTSQIILWDGFEVTEPEFFSFDGYLWIILLGTAGLLALGTAWFFHNPTD